MPNSPPSIHPPDPEVAARLAWIRKVRGLHRTKRMLAFAGVVLGAALMAWWKFDGSVPDWTLWTGLVVLLGSWSLMIWVMFARWRWVKQNPYTPAA